MFWKKLLRHLLFPPIAMVLPLLPASAGLLIYTMLSLPEHDPIRIASYVLAFYALLLCCLRVPRLIRRWRAFRETNRHARRWRSDAHLRIRVSLCGSILCNGAYAALQLGLGIYHAAAWFYSLSAYYFLLLLMRASLARYALRCRPGEDMPREFRLYRACGLIFLVMNLALSAMMLHMLLEGRMMHHHEITTIAMAAYTFAALAAAIVNVIRYRKYNSPVFSASKAISLAAACVSMLTLERVMLTTFSDGGMDAQTQFLFLALSGGAVAILILSMAAFMIIKANRQIKQFGEHL